MKKSIILAVPELFWHQNLEENLSFFISFSARGPRPFQIAPRALPERPRSAQEHSGEAFWPQNGLPGAPGAPPIALFSAKIDPEGPKITEKIREVQKLQKSPKRSMNFLVSSPLYLEN